MAEAAQLLEGAPSARPSPARFTALELAAAEHLIHLSESSSSAAASSSPRSVNAPPADDEDDEAGGRRRRRRKNKRRYRPIAEIYAATEPEPPKPIRERAGGQVEKDDDRPRPAAGAAREAGGGQVEGE